MEKLEVRLAVCKTLYELFKKYPDTFYKDLDFYKNDPNIFPFTRTELDQIEDDDLRIFIKKNFGIIESHKRNKFTDAYENFNYNLYQILIHDKILTVAYATMYNVIISNPDLMETELGYEYENEELFEKELRLSQNFHYDQLIISLISIFEAYLNDLLNWIYHHDKDSRNYLKAELTFKQILENKNDYNKLLDLIINYNINSLHSWSKKRDMFNSPFINLAFDKRDEYKIISEAIARRNCIIHNQGKVDKNYKYQTKSNLRMGTKLKSDHDYYWKLQTAIDSLVKYLDNLILSRYSK